jgi:hypothetical protein
MRALKLFTYLVILGFSLSACSSDTMPRYSIIQGLRTLALVADSPEINFDGTSFTPNTVTITPTISDLYGSGRALSFNLYWCLDPGIGLGVIPSCDGNPSAVRDATLQNVAITAPSGTFSSPNYTGSLAPIPLNFTPGFMGATAFSYYTARFLSLTSAQLYNGYSILVFFELYPTGDTSQKITTFKRIVFSSSTKTLKNTNPSNLEIRRDGTEITSLPSSQSSLEAYLPSSQAESYFTQSTLGALSTATETLETAWFFTGPSDISCSKKKECTTDGYFALARSVPGELNLFYPPQGSIPSTRGRILIGVAKDNRGGSSVKRYVDGTGP